MNHHTSYRLFLTAALFTLSAVEGLPADAKPKRAQPHIETLGFDAAVCGGDQFLFQGPLTTDVVVEKEPGGVTRLRLKAGSRLVRAFNRESGAEFLGSDDGEIALVADADAVPGTTRTVYRTKFAGRRPGEVFTARFLLGVSIDQLGVPSVAIEGVSVCAGDTGGSGSIESRELPQPGKKWKETDDACQNCKG